MNKSLQPKESGYAIVMVLLALVILSVMGGGLLAIGLHSRLYSLRTVSEIAARSAADAGLTKALFEMNEKLKVQPWNDSDLPEVTDEALSNSNATLSYTVTGDLASSYIIESTGNYGRAEKNTNGTLQLQGPFEYAIFTQNGIALKNGATIDWYNYNEDDKSLQIGTNSIAAGAIDLKNGTTINGDVVVGVDGDPEVVINNQWSSITGETHAMTESFELSPITVPAYLQEMPSQGSITDTTTIVSSSKYDGINLANSKIITIDGAVSLYIVGDITLKNSAELQIVDAETNPDASLTLYLGGNVEIKNSGAINNIAEDAKKFKLYGLDSCQSIILKNGSNFYGAIYAPNADVQMHNSAETFGAVVAKSFEQKNSAPFNYDASLREVDTDDEVVHFVITRWNEE